MNHSIPYAIAFLAVGTVGFTQGNPAVERLVDHYTRVEQELRRAPTSHLTASQRSRRASAIDALARYRQRADFGRTVRDDMFPRFVDDAGRRCAVAWMLDSTGAGQITLSVAERHNEAWVCELTDDPDLKRWLHQHGLTPWEAARIQAPNYGSAGSINTPQPRRNLTPPPRQGGPLDVPRVDIPQPDGPATRSPGRTSGGLATSSTPDRAPVGPSIASLPVQDWRAWWQWNRLSYIAPPDSHGDDSLGSSTNDVFLDEVESILLASLEDPSFLVRHAAVTSLGRALGRRAVEPLTGMLDDVSHEVRNQTILALGATGAARGVREIAKVVSRSSGETEVSHLATPLGIVALGLARLQGASPAVDGLVAALPSGLAGADRERAELAALLYQRLAPNDSLAELAERRATDANSPRDLRVRAIECLGLVETSLPELMDLRDRRDLATRQSTSFALGSSSDDLALPALMTGFELERESLARAFTLLGIGAHGEPEAGEFLLEQLREGPKPLRPWAAVAIGCHTRTVSGGATTEICDSLLRAWQHEKNRDARPAYLVALGLAESANAIPMLRQTLEESTHFGMRAAAVEALFLIGTDPAVATLRARLQRDPCRFVRAHMAELLGLHGEPADAPAILAELRSTTPEFRAQIVYGIAHCDTPEVRDALVEVAEDPAGAADLRAAAIHGLGILAAATPSYRLTELGRNSNYLMFPSWMENVAMSGF